MSVIIHRLMGCAPSPIAHYLKALGVLRLVANQADPQARGFWRDDVFHLVTRLDRDALLDFFLWRYQPTPLVAPWNGGSGFYPKDNKSGIDALASAQAARFAPYREAITRAREAVAERRESPKDEEKLTLVQQLRQAWSGGEFEWLNAAVVIAQEELKYPALLGTGGNDGRLDFTNNQMQVLIELIDPQSGAARPEASELLELALFGKSAQGLWRQAIGQFFPGAAGGANASSDFSGASSINPWDFVLNFEGAVLLQVAAVRRLESGGLAQAAAPFAVRGRAAGYGSASAEDESARGEQWMPLWSGPALLSEVSALFAEGRLQSGAKRAQTALEAARALARLGAARGITAFERYGFIERNGQANFAVPLGRWVVRNDGRVSLLDEVDAWVERLRGASHAKGAPDAIGRWVRRIEGTMLEVVQDSGRTDVWRELLCVLGATEDELVRRPKWTGEQRLEPLPLLSPGWLEAAQGEDAEFWLAAAIASQRAPAWMDQNAAARSSAASAKVDPGESARWGRLGSIRANCVPLDMERSWPRFAGHGDQLVKAAEVVWLGRSLEVDLASVAQRRLMDGERSSIPGFPLVGRFFPRLDDISRFLLGQTDDRRISQLARGLMAVDWRKGKEARSLGLRKEKPKDPSVFALHALFRLCYLPPAERRSPDSTLTLGDDRQINLDGLRKRPSPVPLRHLLAGRLPAAIDSALGQLASRGLRPRFHHGFGDAGLARRLAASLAIPVSSGALRMLAWMVVKPDKALTELSQDDASTLSTEI